MKNVWVKRQKLDFGDYTRCTQCGMWWNSFITFNIYDSQFILCPECFDELKEQIKKIG